MNLIVLKSYVSATLFLANFIELLEKTNKKLTQLDKHKNQRIFQLFISAKIYRIFGKNMFIFKSAMSYAIDASTATIFIYSVR